MAKKVEYGETAISCQIFF